MSIPRHSIIPRTEDDTQVLATMLRASKLQLAINRFIFKDWPNEAAQQANYTEAIVSSSEDPNVTSLKVVDDASGEIVAHLVLTTRTASAQYIGATSKPPEAELIPETVSMVENAVAELNKEWIDIDHLRLTWLLVRPESRGKGIGAALVRHASEKARDARLPLVFNTEPAAHDFFLKQGFKDTKHVNIDLRQWAPKYSGYGVFRISGMTSA